MIEAGASSTVGIVTVRVWHGCAAHRRSSWSHHRQSCATLQGRKAKAALGKLGKIENSAAKGIIKAGARKPRPKVRPGWRGESPGRTIAY